MLNADLLGAADDAHSSPEVDRCPRDTAFKQNSFHFIGRIPFCDAAEIHTLTKPPELRRLRLFL